MSLAENLLNTLNTNAYQDRQSEAEPHIVIGKDRKITVPSQLSRIAIENDKDIQTVTFDMPRYWDGIDMYGFAIYVNFIIPNSQKTDSYIPLEIQIDPIDDTILHFDWTISSYMTQNVGNISFLVTARKTDDRGNLKYQWSSDLGSFSVGQGMDVGSVPPNEEDYDILTQILNIVQIEESELNSVLNYIMPIEGADEPDEPIVPDEPVIPPVEPDEPDEPDEPVDPEINYVNVIVSAVNSAVATATYIDGQNAQQTAQIGSNTTLQVKKGSTISFSGSEFVSCDSTIAPSDYPSRNSIIFMVSATQEQDITITLDSVGGRQYEAPQITSHNVKIHLMSVAITTAVIAVKINGTTVQTLTPSRTQTMKTEEFNISVNNGEKLTISSTANATYSEARLYQGGNIYGEELADFTYNKLDYSVDSVNSDLEYFIVMQQQLS